MKASIVVNNNDDLSVANIARVSMGKWNDTLQEGDPKLIKYLADHGHISPFFHQRFTFTLEGFLFNKVNDPTLLMGAVWRGVNGYLMFRTSLYGWSRILKTGLLTTEDDISIGNALLNYAPIASKALGITYNTYGGSKACTKWGIEDFTDVSMRLDVPIFVARQLFTHRMFATNEISRRYVSDGLQFHNIEQWRTAPKKSIKQGSGEDAGKEVNSSMKLVTDLSLISAMETYEIGFDVGLAPEQLRSVLPQSMMTSIIFTGSVTAWKNMLKLRLDSHAQKEVQEIAKLIENELKNIQEV